MAAVCECVFVRMCVCAASTYLPYITHTLRSAVFVFILLRGMDMNFFLSLVGRQKEETKDAWKKNVQHTLLRTSRPEATALYGFIFFNILARKILYYIEGKIHAQRLPSNGHVNFICFLRAHKSKKIVFYKKYMCVAPFNGRTFYIYFMRSATLFCRHFDRKEKLKSRKIHGKSVPKLHQSAAAAALYALNPSTINCSRWISNQ